MQKRIVIVCCGRRQNETTNIEGHQLNDSDKEAMVGLAERLKDGGYLAPHHSLTMLSSIAKCARQSAELIAEVVDFPAGEINWERWLWIANTQHQFWDNKQAVDELHRRMELFGTMVFTGHPEHGRELATLMWRKYNAVEFPEDVPDISHGEALVVDFMNQTCVAV